MKILPLQKKMREMIGIRSNPGWPGVLLLCINSLHLSRGTHLHSALKRHCRKCHKGNQAGEMHISSSWQQPDMGTATCTTGSHHRGAGAGRACHPGVPGNSLRTALTSWIWPKTKSFGFEDHEGTASGSMSSGEVGEEPSSAGGCSGGLRQAHTQALLHPWCGHKVGLCPV